MRMRRVETAPPRTPRAVPERGRPFLACPFRPRAGAAVDAAFARVCLITPVFFFRLTATSLVRRFLAADGFAVAVLAEAPVRLVEAVFLPAALRPVVRFVVVRFAVLLRFAPAPRVFARPLGLRSAMAWLPHWPTPLRPAPPVRPILQTAGG